MFENFGLFVSIDGNHVLNQHVNSDFSHPCPGLCGEPCPPCKECHPDLKCSISLRTLSEFEKDEKVYMLPECGCGKLIVWIHIDPTNVCYR